MQCNANRDVMHCNVNRHVIQCNINSNVMQCKVFLTSWYGTYRLPDHTLKSEAARDVLSPLV